MTIFDPNVEYVSLGMSLSGLAIALMAGTAVYTSANQSQAFRVNFLAAAIIGTLAEMTLHLVSIYSLCPPLSRITLGVRNLMMSLAILDLYLKILGPIGSTFTSLQNVYSMNVAILSGFMVAQLGSHVYSLCKDLDTQTT